QHGSYPTNPAGILKVFVDENYRLLVYTVISSNETYSRTYNNDTDTWTAWSLTATKKYVDDNFNKKNLGVPTLMVSHAELNAEFKPGSNDGAGIIYVENTDSSDIEDGEVIIYFGNVGNITAVQITALSPGMELSV